MEVSPARQRNEPESFHSDLYHYAGENKQIYLCWKYCICKKHIHSNLVPTFVVLAIRFQIAGTLKYFLAVFLISIFFFADMVDIVKKTSGECDFVDGEIEGSLETFCSLTPLQTYLSMYAIMVRT